MGFANQPVNKLRVQAVSKQTVLVRSFRKRAVLLCALPQLWLANAVFRCKAQMLQSGVRAYEELRREKRIDRKQEEPNHNFTR